MDSKLAVMSGVGLGAGLMYLLDPGQGRRRRGLVRDKIRSYADRSGQVVGKTSRDVSHRARGLVAQTRARLRPAAVPDDDVLEARVLSKLGRHVSHPRAIEVEAREGRVTLRGPVLAFELDDLLRAVADVRGVAEVENQLETHDEPDDVPGLQGGGWDDDPVSDGWPRAARLLAGAAGGSLAVYGLKRKDPIGAALGSLGLGLLIRGLADVDLRRVLRLGGDGAIDVQRTIHINAPVDRVFDVWTDYQNFPRFLSGIGKVWDLGQGRSHWVSEGPGGVPLEWDAVLTAYEPNALFGWESLPGASIPNLGSVAFAPDAEGGTRVQVFLSFAPPAGARSKAGAAPFGADPQRQLDDGLLAMKTFVETGAPDGPSTRPEPSDRVTNVDDRPAQPSPGL